MEEITHQIRVISTGGTIDKLYDPISGELGFAESSIPSLLHYANPHNNVAVTQLLSLDSLDMTDQHRSDILEACKKSAEKHILITHGTDTMVETAYALKELEAEKHIVLVGAMIPASIKESDAAFNLGYALSSLQHSQPGIFICMNGRTFSYREVMKDKSEGCFISTSSGS
ncbi:MAG: asparaginase [Planctomycetes bacterium]|nr:asparaginase [Planctomycetota bacterium]